MSVKDISRFEWLDREKVKMSREREWVEVVYGKHWRMKELIIQK